MTHKREKRVVEAEEFCLLDSARRVRARLMTWSGDGSPSLQLYDEDGLQRVSIGIDNRSNAHISVLRKDGNIAVGLGSDGASGYGVAVYDENGLPIFHVRI